MRSVKPGRGPSAMGAIGSLVGVIFGVIWIGAAASAGAPSFFLAFGVLFVLLGIGQAIYNFKNATGENRFSEFDITEEGEEPDPLECRARGTWEPEEESPGGGVCFCPYCGTKLGEGFAYCAKCGRELPEIES